MSQEVTNFNVAHLRMKPILPIICICWSSLFSRRKAKHVQGLNVTLKHWSKLAVRATQSYNQSVWNNEIKVSLTSYNHFCTILYCTELLIEVLTCPRCILRLPADSYDPLESCTEGNYCDFTNLDFASKPQKSNISK